MTLDYNFQILDIKHQANRMQSNHDGPINQQLMLSLFSKSKVRGMFWRLWKRVLHHPVRMKSLSDFQINSKIVNSFAPGLKSVPVDKIVGSVSRCEDFDAQFSPISDRTVERWARVAQIFFEGGEISAVDLIQVADQYFVRDGHHRISVAKALGKKFIDASVTVLHLQGQIF